ncbi:cytochrome d ubiquinol oxidase subunit II [Nitratifractor salsuginis]|uniref:Cytochrome bd quinol oxidase subunit 2 apoprotein n=1 Tax=Nitratifractor salsuginis (strain DSM 16511 / JCM 12458 / E9I37-1) TaxID=749222 RepID=E6X165_NITSE|nr:cytochrome d ubiquinol oxidase subunit II [Nitratifractor salsuginis]ADV45868.1 cytochrome bd quinol oxidase subunit 2 apoprotein [Nitratifractor salsuginis DSM 16511]
MFEKLSYLTLQEYWWFLIALLGGLFVFMTFVQGGQTLLWRLGKTEAERDLIVNALGRKWELTFTTLVMFGGALFAAFPLFYAVSFGGAYYVWMAILFCFIIQAVAYEYRKKPNNVFGERTYELFLFINGSLGIILIGIALGTLFTGGHFVVNENHLSHWTRPTYGLEAVLNPFNVAFGLMLFFLSQILAALYFIDTIDEEAIVTRSRQVLKVESLIFLALFAYVVYSIVTMSGYGYDPQTLEVHKESFKFLHNLKAMPFVAGMILLGTVLLLSGIGMGLFAKSDKGIWPAGLGVVMVVVGLFLLLGYNHTVFYPSLDDPQSSLSIQNASGSRYTLIAMSYVSLMVPLVLGYIIVVWRAMNRHKMTIQEVENDPHHY